MDESNRVKQKVHYGRWRSLTTACNIHGILPPTRGIDYKHNIHAHRTNSTRKQKKAKKS